MGEYRSVSWLLFVNCVILLCVLSNVSVATYIEDEIANRGLNCTAVLIEKPLQRASSPTEEMAQSSDTDYTKATSIYDFTVKDTFGNDVSLEKYRGNVVIIVNIASQCGLTKNHYAKLTQLRNEYYDKGLRILGFPCNQFAGQMPEGDGEETVCHIQKEKADFGDIFAKVNVNGDSAIPLYKYLKDKQHGTFGNAIKWNFTKFLVDKNGQPVNRYGPTTDPMDLVKDIEKLF